MFFIKHKLINLITHFQQKNPMKFSRAAFCLIVILGLYTASAYPKPKFDPCKSACKVESDARDNACYKRLNKMPLSLEDVDRIQLTGCKGPFGTYYSECVETCPDINGRPPRKTFMRS